VHITRTEAEQLALKNNPRISAAHLIALAEAQTVRQARAAELPQIVGSMTAVKAEDATRIGAGQLNSSRLYTHAGTGGTLTQLITDFGRTSNLVATAKLRTKAEEQGARAATADVIFATDEAFYRLLGAQSLLDVARRTVEARTSVRDVTQALAASKLKSELDINVAAANLSEAQLLLLDAQNGVETASATLSALLATPQEAPYFAAEEPEVLPFVSAEEPSSLQALALQNRPDLAALNLGSQADQKFARAQWLQHLPSISASATGGVTPVRPDNVFPENWYAAAGVNLNLPIFTGFRISAETREAQYRAQASERRVTDLSNGIKRDVQTASLVAQTAFQRVGVTDAFRDQAAKALGLTQTRYKLGLSSIVELSQAELQSTQASVTAVNARYEYLLALRSLEYVTGRIVP
jgi:outer membrane protein